MTICDSCRNPATTFVSLKIDAKNPSDCVKDTRFDFCGDCARQASANAFLVGVVKLARQAARAKATE